MPWSNRRFHSQLVHGGRKQAIVAKAHLNLVAPGSRFRVVIVVVIVGVAVVVVSVAATATALCTYYIDYYVSIYLLPNSTLQIIRPKLHFFVDYHQIACNICVSSIKQQKQNQKTPFRNHHLFVSPSISIPLVATSARIVLNNASLPMSNSPPSSPKSRGPLEAKQL